MNFELLIPGYYIRRGSTLERSLLVKFMQRTYQDIYPEQDFAHLARTVEQYFSKDTPLWWVDFLGKDVGEQGNKEDKTTSSLSSRPSPIACLWAGNAIDQVTGTRHPHIFLLYVVPEHRRRGVGTALMRYIENWAIQRGDRQIGLQVFKSNQAALNLYNQLGYQTQSLWMLKQLDS
ncbi:GNAT family N-acetyltransferase [Anabaena sp. UHCC 0399]|uniref:GNAT family N-acetyltransferase n=1 Tax=Anabaena sp. UHCC 0399 TaxID=3110238 RepID=UPI002B21497B|nr:GNAT family N-acetyltransferase [Anabaena sp. UHCC 0399]MEA5569217.1 GNAT family N-acetyltransferase [Anabaena sp. UHCC 0399]